MEIHVNLDGSPTLESKYILHHSSFDDTVGESREDMEALSRWNDWVTNFVAHRERKKEGRMMGGEQEREYFWRTHYV